MVECVHDEQLEKQGQVVVSKNLLFRNRADEHDGSKDQQPTEKQGAWRKSILPAMIGTPRPELLTSRL